MDEEEALRGLQETATRFRADIESMKPAVPAEIAYAYQVEEVRSAIARRLIKGESLVSRHVLFPDILLDLYRVYFVFQPEHGPDETHPGILVQLKDDLRLAELIDPLLLERARVRETSVYEGSFPLVLSKPLQREGLRNDRALNQFEKFVKREGLEAAFARLQGGFGEVGGDFASGTCVLTYNEPPVYKPVGAPTLISSWDVDYVEDDFDLA